MSDNERWALILGASSGFGAACSRALAEAGFNIFGAHFDLKSTQHLAQQVKEDIEAKGRKAFFYNKNVADERNRAEIIEKISDYFNTSGGGSLAVVLHSLAFGNLKPFI